MEPAIVMLLMGITLFALYGRPMDPIVERTAKNRDARSERFLRGAQELAKFELGPELDELALWAEQHYDEPTDPLYFTPRSNVYHKKLLELDYPAKCGEVTKAYQDVENKIKSFFYCMKSGDIDWEAIALSEPKFMQYMRALRICEEMQLKALYERQRAYAPEKPALY